MSDIAIRVENLSKLYTIGRAQQRHDTLRDTVAGLRLKVAGSFRPRHLQPANLEPPTDLWALRDVSFEVKQGVKGCWRWGTRRFRRKADRDKIWMYTRSARRQIHVPQNL